MAVSAQHISLVAGTPATVTLSSDFQTVDVVNVNGAGVIYARSDGTFPTVKGDDCDVVVAAAGAFTTLPAPGNTTVVKLISAAAVDVAVVGRI